MSTRGAWGFRWRGVDKITYNHSNSYPTGLGLSVLEFVAKTPRKEMVDIFNKIILVAADDKPTMEQSMLYSAGKGRDCHGRTDWYETLRLSQGDPFFYLEPSHVHIIDNKTFLLDSLFCEWAYVINLDEGLLEVYRGCQKRRGGGRYAGRRNEEGYYGVSLIKEVPLSRAAKFTEEKAKEVVQSWRVEE